MICYRRNRNLGDKLVRAKIQPEVNPTISESPIHILRAPLFRSSSTPCSTPGCKCCQVMSRKEQISSSKTFRSYRLPDRTNCNSMNVIYLIECKLCPKGNQYVCQTSRPLKQRLSSSHRAASVLQTKKDTPLYKHFRRKNHLFPRDASISILEVTTQPQLLNRETHWINTLVVRIPDGLNSRYQ